MAVSLTIDQGKLTAQIPDNRGCEAPYAVERITLPFARWACHVSHSGKRPARYRVWLDDMGWHCSCPDATKGRARKLGYDCKHIQNCAELATLEGIFVAAKKPETGPTPDNVLRLKLRNPFHPGEVKWKAQATSGDKTKALAVAYVDARAVMDRLDEVLGNAGWKDEYVPQEGGNFVCRLSLRIGGEWIAKEDVGNPSEQPDAGDKMKAAFSDALKRAAVKFGVGRYLYHLPQVWVGYDAQRRRLAQTPSLPAWALPQDPATFQEPPPPAEAPPPPEEPAVKAPVQAQQPAPPAQPKAAANGAPAKDRTLSAQILEYDERQSKRLGFERGELYGHVAESLLEKFGQPHEWNSADPTVNDAARTATEEFMTTAKQGNPMPVA